MVGFGVVFFVLLVLVSFLCCLHAGCLCVCVAVVLAVVLLNLIQKVRSLRVYGTKRLKVVRKAQLMCIRHVIRM